MPEILTESFCERCGTRYTFESAVPRTARLKGIKVLSRGLKNFVLSDDTSIDEAMAAARSDTDREATTQQLDAFHKTFNFCMSCRQYTCGNCWNEAEGRCLSCAPHLGHEIMPAPFPDLDPGHGLALGAVAETNGSHVGNGHAPQESAADALAWPSMDLDRTTEDDDVGIEPIDAVARLSFLSAVSADDDDDLPETGIDDAAATAAESAAVLDAIPDIADEPAPVSAEVEVATEVEAAVEVEPPVSADAPIVADDAQVGEPDDIDGRAAAAATQTNDLMRRFRPGQSLDDEIAAYEREQAAAAALAAAALRPEESVTVEPEAVEPAAAEVEPEPVAAEPEPVAVEPERVDLVEQPTWRIVAPEAEVTPPPIPTAPSADPLPVQAAATPEPQWPAQPEWPSQRPAGGLPFLARPTAPTGGMEALWAESAREVANPTLPAGAAAKVAGGVQPCVSCGLSLSGTARICRRCGTRQS